MCNSLEEKKEIQNNILSVIKNPTILSNKITKPFYIIIPIIYSEPLINVSILFPKSTYYATSPITCLIRIKSKFPLPIRFRKLSVNFSDKNYDRQIIDNSNQNDNNLQSESDNLVFIPNKSKLFTFDFISKEKTQLMVILFYLTKKNINNYINSVLKFLWNLEQKNVASHYNGMLINGQVFIY
jgi:hypothetical protein